HTPLVGVPEEKRERAIGRRDTSGEGGAESPRITTWRLDLDDVGAEVGEEAPREGAAEVGQVDDAEMGEWPEHAAVYSGRAASGKRRSGPYGRLRRRAGRIN